MMAWRGNNANISCVQYIVDDTIDDEPGNLGRTICIVTEK